MSIFSLLIQSLPNKINQGPLKKRTEHSQYISFEPENNLKSSHQDLSNEGSKDFLSSLELGSWAAQTWGFR